MLEMPSEWRFGNPGELDPAAVNAFYDLVRKVAGQGNSWSIIELFKSKFNGGTSWSSSESWAVSDLHSAMHGGASNAPAFIDAFWTGCEEVKSSYPAVAVPDVGVVNALLAQSGEPYELRPPKLVWRGKLAPPEVHTPPASLGDKARALIQRSLAEADRFILDQKPRQAVQEILWLLETVSTAFDGRDSGAGIVEGKYFNTIVRDLRKLNHGSAHSEILSWITKFHGFLSSPSGGGVRHGTHLASGRPISLHEAQLYCNLTRSYIGYLLAELDEMPSKP
jgi:hypothetical protein